MVDLAIKILAVIAGIWAAFASYPELNAHVLAVLALLGAVAVGILAGYLVYLILSWLFGGLNLRPRT